MSKAMLKAQSNLKLTFALVAVIALLPQYANALSCAQPSLNKRAQHTIDHSETSAIIRGVLKLPEQQYIYNQDRFYEGFSTRSSYGTIDGFIATANGFSTPISAKVEFREACHRWPNTNICNKDKNVASSVKADTDIYFLGIGDTSYILSSSDCSMNSIAASPENIEEIATCFINGNC